jgi:transglutaminase-like putative cysteine protease
MRLRISHLTSYRYEAPATSTIQMLRLTPRNHDGQYIADWRIDVSADCRLNQHEDAFGNVTHAFTAEGPLRELSVLAEGEVETRDTQGVVRGAVERFPPSLYLRETPLSEADAGIAAFAADASETAGENVLALLHLMLDRLHADIVCDSQGVLAGAASAAADVFARKRGSSQELAHIFIAACRNLGIPARYVAGYVHGDDGRFGHNAGHAWAEAHVPGLGWVAFDPANGLCATDAHVRVAVALDALGAAPIRGTRYGGGEELTVKVLVDQAGQQAQN